MSNFTKEKIDYYANALLIGLTDEERDMIQREFDDIETSMELINKIDGIKEVEPQSYPFEMEALELRSDEDEGEEIPIDILLRNAGSVDGREVEVPKVVG
jgi:aspartyl/glutamyl-tRNA(Asn/Gln) amidotransferase C subunit